MQGKNPYWYLKNCDLFARLPAEDLEALERLAAARTFRRGALIYAPSQAGETVMVLASGRVKIKDVTPDGKETILAFVEEGEMFGELALVDDRPRQEYAEAVRDSLVLSLPKDALTALMESRPGLALHVTRLIGVRRRRIENRLCNVLFLPARDRLLRLLAELTEEHGEADEGRIHLRVALSHQDMAGLIGVTRETVTVTLGQLQAEGILRVHRRRLIILDPARLAGLARNGLPEPAGPVLPG